MSAALTTDTGVIAAVVGVLVFTLRWFIGQLTASREQDRETIKRLIDINVAQSTQLAELKAKVERIPERKRRPPKRKRDR